MRNIFAGCLFILFLSNISNGQEVVVEVNQSAWSQLSLQVKKLWSEQLGEAGARAWAKSQGLTSIEFNKLIAQGPDQIYSQNGKIIVIEAKGGTSQLGTGYGYKQASPEWTVESAKKMLDTASKRGDAVTKQAMTTVLEAAANNTLETKVIRATYTKGVPEFAIVEQTNKVNNVATGLAKQYLGQIKVIPPAAPVVIPAPAPAAPAPAPAAAVPDTPANSRILNLAAKYPKVFNFFAKHGKKIVRGAGIAGAAAVTYDSYKKYNEIEQQYKDGLITQEDREFLHVQHGVGKVSGLALAVGGAKVGAIVCAPILPPFGSIAGAIIFGAGTYCAGEYLGEQGVVVLKQYSADTITKMYDGGKFVGGKIADGAICVWDGTKWVTGKVVGGIVCTWDGVKWIGGKIVDGVVYTWDGTKWAASKVADGAINVWDGTKWAAGKVVDGAVCTWDGTKWVGGVVANKIVDGAVCTWDGTKWVAGVVANKVADTWTVWNQVKGKLPLVMIMDWWNED